MALSNVVKNGSTYEEVDPGYISDAAMEQLCTTMAYENLNPEEFNEYVKENMDVVTEAAPRKTIWKMSKQDKMNQLEKVAILQCAAEDKAQEYKKLRTLWKLEAKLFKKLEKKYGNKAKARAREAYKNQQRKAIKSPVTNKAVSRVGAKVLGGTSNLMSSGPVHIGANKSSKK